jgi:hypothetical protein
MTLKPLGVSSVHWFPAGLIQCESNLLGIAGRKGAPVGSGGWLKIVEKFAKAKRYCVRPSEIRHEGSRKVEAPIPGEWIGSFRNGEHPPEQREIKLLCDDSSSAKLEGAKFDAVFTDPPYFGNILGKRRRSKNENCTGVAPENLSIVNQNRNSET